MKRNFIKTGKGFAAIFLIVFTAFLMGCSAKGTASEAQTKPSEPVIEKISDEQALAAIKNYCYIANPDLENIVEAHEYPVYWEIASSDEAEIVVLYRSYTGAQLRYYIDRNNGNTAVTEYVPGITDNEEWTEEKFNIKDYF